MKFLSENTILSFLIILLIVNIEYAFSQPEMPKAHVTKIKKVEKKLISDVVSISEKKEHFCNLIVPAINEVHDELELQYYDICENLTNDEYSQKISDLKKSYQVESNEELLMALKPHPISIAIAQAAIESAWGKSRFFKEANNLFGMWSINENKPRIAASLMRGEKTIWLKKYSNIKDSVRDYYKTLARSSAYKDFRELKMEIDDPLILVQKLDKYSEIGAKYTQDLSSMIKYNKLYLYDK
ncbi:MAG: hypothetical protein A2513_05845 [Sulfurimonas sp. RIFOXYD12_FULL_33_39]|uniref:glucosaminidase domain-containing protein n=1 Tax=unclassified Sulfurimonas TaxID=2623549 RepID=UPI0008C3498E|nr:MULTISPECIES: glucosaminidase domain-containing protein [unclassified Sulfurimonas]OHE03076.1 MAG: hypothetical protein A3G74_01725 [Sulfurimonas sp. RIFCSPLOWO2_12_FULL_34_6]OHE10387.1 MAG: hypothetical protein A2513_05845 [Sulfurimonas sp. RIFOXYD12_FULL_33_39]OHE14844.1 MAG: hypothetical protein A2530_00035 [Sulfurimonas sp. RIFOXYD2_FULL_34_21]